MIGTVSSPGLAGNPARSLVMPLIHTKENQVVVAKELYKTVEESLRKKEGKYVLDKPIYAVSSTKWITIGVIYKIVDGVLYIFKLTIRYCVQLTPLDAINAGNSLKEDVAKLPIMPLVRYFIYLMFKPIRPEESVSSYFSRPSTKAPLVHRAKNAVTKAVTMMCTGSSRPFELAGDPGLHLLLDTFGEFCRKYVSLKASDVMPHPTTVSRNVHYLALEIQLAPAYYSTMCYNVTGPYISFLEFFLS
jgi:hypothetical protein